MTGWKRLRAIKERAVQEILPRSDHVAEQFWPSVYAFGFSYSMGRLIVEVARECGAPPSESRVLIVGAFGGRDWHWLVAFGFRPDILDLGHYPWAKATYLGDACEAGTWERVPHDYDLVVLCDVLEHMPRDFDALRHIRSALKPQGKLLLSVPFRHDTETTHVRSYTDVTIRRLLGAAGLGVQWAKFRPGALEVMPTATQALNQALALACPSAAGGGRMLARLLRLEYRINDRTRALYRLVGRSPQKGMIYCCVAKDAVDNLEAQVQRHITPGGPQDPAGSVQGPRL